MNRKNIFSFFLIFLCYNVSINSVFECGLLKQAQDLLAEQLKFNESLQELVAVQAQMGRDLSSIIEILATPKSGNLLYKNSSGLPTKSARIDLVDSIDNLKDSNKFLFDVNGNQIISIDTLRQVLDSQFSSIDYLDEMHVKMDCIIDLLGTSTQLADDLGISLSDCEASLDDCCKGLALLDDCLNSFELVLDDEFLTHIS